MRTNLRASSAPCGRGSKNKKCSLPFFFSSAGGCGGSRQKMERKFLVLLRRFRLQNEHFVLYHLWLFSVVNFSVLTARRDASSRCPVVTLNFIMPPTEFSGNSLKWIVLGTNKSVCACPAHPVRAQIPAVFRRYYKTAGIAPVTTNNFQFFLNEKFFENYHSYFPITQSNSPCQFREGQLHPGLDG